MSRPSVLRTTTAKQSKSTTLVPASAVNNIAKEGEYNLDHDGVKAIIVFAQSRGQWVAEFRARTRCGEFHAGTMPLTNNSERHANLENALHSAATRMVDAMAAATQGFKLNKRQKKAIAALTEWALEFKASPEAKPVKPVKQPKRFLDLFSGIGGIHLPRGTDASVVVADILGKAPVTEQCQQPMERQKADPTTRSNRIEVVGLIEGKDCQGYRVGSPKGKGFTVCANSGGPRFQDWSLPSQRQTTSPDRA
jgi:hypothetical protein